MADIVSEACCTQRAWHARNCCWRRLVTATRTVVCTFISNRFPTFNTPKSRFRAKNDLKIHPEIVIKSTWSLLGHSNQSKQKTGSRLNFKNTSRFLKALLGPSQERKDAIQKNSKINFTPTGARRQSPNSAPETSQNQSFFYNQFQERFLMRFGTS